MQNLQRSYESDVSELEQLLDQEHCEWQKAKGRHEDLREALANADKLERLKPFSSQLSKMTLGSNLEVLVISSSF